MSGLPKGWCMSPLGSVSSLINGDRGENYPSKSDFVAHGIPFVNAGHLHGRSISLSDMNFISKSKFESLGSGKIIKNDILFCLRGSLGKIGVANNLERGAIASSLVIIRVDELICNPYVYYFLESPLGKIEIKKHDNGTAQPNLSSKNLAKFEIPLAPLPEQKRIADKLDATLARVDACRERLARVAPILKRFRQSVLAAATSGQLTADWREQQGHGHAGDAGLDDEGSPTLAAHDERRVSQGQPSLRAETKLYEEIQFVDVREPFSHQVFAPLSWEKSTIGEMVDIIGGSQPPKSVFQSESGDGLIRLIQIRDYKSDKYLTYIPKELARRFCSKTDVMIGRYGPPIFQILRGLEGAYNVALMKAQPKNASLDLDYLFYFLKCDSLLKYIEAGSDRTAGQDGVRKELVLSYPMFVPPLTEQTEIVRRVDTLFAFADRLEARLASATAAAERLTPSLLAKAFRGELVPQDPDDEPASELLKRLAAQREAAGSKPKRGRKTSG